MSNSHSSSTGGQSFDPQTFVRRHPTVTKLMTIWALLLVGMVATIPLNGSLVPRWITETIATVFFILSTLLLMSGVIVALMIARERMQA